MISPFLSSTVVATVNHLLTQELWARELLRAHAGKVACLDAEIVVLNLCVAADGMLEVPAAEAAANVTIRVKAADILLIVQNRERAFSYVKIEGDADFANAISQLTQSLRWEIEADLSNWVGDIAATRMVSTAKSLFNTAKTTKTKLAENLAEYFLEEQPMLVREQAVVDFAEDVAKMRDDVERMAKRIEKLEIR